MLRTSQLTPLPVSATSPATTALEDLRASAALAAARGGVPTVLALQWEGRERPPRAAPGHVVDDGRHLAQRATASWTALAADQRDDDLACVGSVLHATALGVVRDDLRDALPEELGDGGTVRVPAPRLHPAATPRVRASDTVGLASHVASLTGGHHLRVMNYHNTPPSRRDQLRAELTALTRRYRPWTLADLDAVMTTGTWPDDDRPGLLPVFYEGYRASATVAAPVCEELGVTGWFAVCTGFVDCPPAQQELYARSHRIGLLPEDLAGDRAAMTWDDVGALGERHVVLAHTASHAGLEETPSEADLEREVHTPMAALRAATGRTPPGFAWLHGSPTRMSARHDAAVREAGYRYLVSNTMLHHL